MFSGDSSGEGLLNHFAQYQMQAAASGGAGIDWATLAQQWIQMKDCLPATQNIVDYTYKEVIPPPPRISSFQQPPSILKTDVVPKQVEEKGEADMDMDDDEDDTQSKNQNNNNSSPPPPPPSMTVGAGMTPSWYIQNQINSGQSNNVPLQTPASVWNNWQGPINTVPTNPILPMHPGNKTAHIPSLLNINVMNPNEFNEAPEVKTSSDLPNSGVDVAKRKILPAWIREGLEKMEREKQKQLEREKQEKEKKKQNLWESDNEEEEVNSNHKNLVNNFDSKSRDVYSSGNEEEVDTKRNLVNYKADTGDESDSELADKRVAPQRTTAAKAPVKPCKTFEEKLNALMIAVRRNLTELLLEVTDKEIANVVQETLRAQRMKASSAQVIRKSAISSITGKLGLAAYADSSDSESESEDSDNERRPSNYDSEEELRQTIRSKRRTFAKISDEIEKRVSEAADREEAKLLYYKNLEKQKYKNNERGDSVEANGKDYHHMNSNDRTDSSSISKYGKFGKTFNKDFGEATVSKLHNLNGKNSAANRKERTTRFSDNKDSRSVTAAAAAAVVAATAFSSNKTSQKPQPIQNPATALLQMPPVTTANDVDLLNHLSKSKNSSGIHNMLNAADEVLEKATKNKSSSGSYSSSNRKRRRSYSSEEEKRRHRRKHDESDSSSSSDSEDSSKSSSSHRSSKYSRSPSDRKSDRYSSRDRYGSSSSSRRYSSRGDHKKESSSSYSKRSSDRYKDDHYSSSSKRHHRYHSSDSEDEADYHKKKSKSSSSSKYISSRSSSKRYRSRSHSRSRSRSNQTRSRSRSRSHSTYSSSSKHRSRH